MFTETVTRYQVQPGLAMNTFGKGGETGGYTGGYTRSGDFLILGINVLLFPVSMFLNLSLAVQISLVLSQ